MNTDWPRDDETGEVFDDEWLRAGTTGSLTPDQIERAANAAAHFGSDTNPASKAEQAEYHRQAAAIRRDARLTMPGDAGIEQRDALVRGRDTGEWLEYVDHLKRSGHLELALALIYECIDAAERAGRIDQSFHTHAAVILRKMKDYDTEVHLLENFVNAQVRLGRTPEGAIARLAKARQLLMKDSM